MLDVRSSVSECTTCSLNGVAPAPASKAPVLIKTREGERERDPDLCTAPC